MSISVFISIFISIISINYDYHYHYYYLNYIVYYHLYYAVQLATLHNITSNMKMVCTKMGQYHSTSYHINFVLKKIIVVCTKSNPKKKKNVITTYCMVIKQLPYIIH